MKKIYMFLLLMSAMFFVSCNQDAFIKSVKVPVSGSTTGGTSGGTGGTTGGGIVWEASNTLSNVVVPTTATVGGTLNISFDYTTTAYRRVYIAVKSADWSTEYVKEDIRDLGPNGNKSVNLDLTGITAGSYKVAIEVLENTDTYTGLSPQVGSWHDLTISN